MRRICAGLALALAVALIPSGAFAAQRSGGEQWVATWMAAPLEGSSRDIFRNQTLRMIVHTSVGGKRVRVEFSNAFGKESLIIGAAHVAISSQGAAIVPRSDRALSFDGAASVTIPPGALEVSDPVDLNVAASSNLAISIYVPDATGPPTMHPLGLQKNYISAAGNFTSAASMPYEWTVTSWYWLSGVDVEASPGSSAIVALGDSITDGANSTPNTNRRWPNQLATRLLANPATAHLAVVNAGISGNRILHDMDGPNALARLDRDVLARAGVKYLIVLEGINDLGFPHLPGSFGQQEVTSDALIAGLRQMIDRAHAHGIKVFGCTLTPYEGAVYYSKEGETKRAAINQWIRTSGAFDGVIDFDAAVRDPKNPKRFLPAYDSGDHLHPNDAGLKAMADAIDLKIFQ
ncbi:MAG: SGNH/GDSL hydrolase family protein [Acidobacteriota bacterium]|nr:SGNH/GDSL hydrolase family protein [Acidobacteriota bacterium]